MTADLSKTLGVFRGSALMMSIVIGAGLLTLPGLAIKVAGSDAFLAWVVCALAALPLLGVFIVLGRRHPEAGGISAYAGRAFGPFGARAASLLFLGAVVFGLPSIALTGGHYIAATAGGSPHAFALGLLLSAVLPHLIPGEGAAKAMSWIASTVLVVIVSLLAAGFLGLPPAPPATPPLISEQLHLAGLLAPFMMLFFAFTGWEVGAGIAEEFKNPRRDYPLAMILSFTAATALYGAIAYVAQRTDLTGFFEAPFVAVVRPLLGDFGATAVAITAALIVFANLAGAVWGVSRLVFGLSRDGALPAVLAKTSGGRPIAAVIATVSALTLVLSADWIGDFGMETMLGIAGQNFLILYGVAAGALLVLSKSPLHRGLALIVVALVLALLAIQGPKLAYPIALVAVASAASLYRLAKPRPSTATGRPASILVASDFN